MFWASNKLIWIPFYLLLTYYIYKANGWKAIAIVLLAGLLILCSDQLTSGVIKNVVKRPRPSHVEAIKEQIHLVNDYHGGPYGFPSSHAANSFALAVFVMLVLRGKDKGLKYVLLSYAILVSYSRVYLGVHYPGDIFFGMLVGAGLGWTFYKLWKWLESSYFHKESIE